MLHILYITYMKNIILLVPAVFLLSCSASKNAGKAYHHNAQQIPGKVQCEYFDTGGEGISYHDADSINNGSGKLNPANGKFLNEFRMKEGVDISYTKTGGVDDNPYNKIKPDSNQLYVGWTVPGEWIKYSIKARETCIYKIAAMYTSHGDGLISLDIDGQPETGSIKIISTINDKEPVPWRQWHHWNKADSLTSLKISKGNHELTLHIIDHGQMNFDYLEFIKISGN